jgi:hypothetical protein
LDGEYTADTLPNLKTEERMEMERIVQCKMWCCCLVLFSLLLVGGCASTKGSYTLASSPKFEEQAAKYSNLKVDLNSNSNVSLGSGDKERILNLIVKNVPAECPNRFRNVNASDTDQQTLYAVVNITRYDEGNAFARAMLAGLGQMHIDATVTLSDYQTKEELSKYEVTKTFAWGGLYGGFTDIKSVEEGFAKAVAASFSGKKEAGG